MGNSSNIPSSSGGSMLTMEQLLLNFYLESLRDFSRIWLSDSDMSESTLERYQMQFWFLVESIPSSEIRDTIWKKQQEKEREMTRNNTSMAYEKSCMCAVSAVMEFLASTFDLLHEDIIGGATSKQYRNAVLEIPDMVVPVVESPPTEPMVVINPEPIMEVSDGQ